MKKSVQATDLKGPSPLSTRIADVLRELFTPSYILDIDVLLDNLDRNKKELRVT